MNGGGGGSVVAVVIAINHTKIVIAGWRDGKPAIVSCLFLSFPFFSFRGDGEADGGG